MANSHKHAREHGRTRQAPRAHAHAHAQRRRRIAHLVLPAAGLLTIIGASTAVVANNASSPVVAQASAGDRGDLITSALQSNQQLSRNAERAPLPNEAEAEKLISGYMYVIQTDAADVYADADDTSPVLAVLAPGEKVAVTKEKKRGWTQIVHKDAPRWVKSSALTKEQELSDKPCAKADESGLQRDTIRVIRAVCAKFPAVRSYGGTRGGGGDHGAGLAVDIMVDSATGDQVAAFLQKNASKLGIEYLIWKQRIWRPATSNSWRGMSDRGSPTANHMDHVHANT
ncbi:MAG: SH3 domain-containing protein [Aeromicrobium sp.]